MADFDGITADDLRALAAALGRDMHSVRRLAAVLGQDIHDLRLRLATPTGTDGNGSVTDVVSGTEMFIDPFSVNLIPLSLPLPEAFARLTAVLATHANSDHVIAWVSSHSWEDFYRKLVAAAVRFPDFLHTAVNVQQRFGFASSPAPSPADIAVIPASAGYASIADWVGRYDQVYSAVLVMRFAAGTVPEEFR